MQLDWVTILAQIANFLILIWLLQRFLYAPITRAMARREERIEDRLADARAARKDAEDQAQALRDKQAALDERKDAILAEAREEARQLRKKLEAEARADIEARHAAWLEDLEQDRAEHIATVEQHVMRHVFKVVRRILSEFAATDLASGIAAEFIHRLETLDDDQRDRLANAAGHARETAVVESGIDLPASDRARITRAIHEHLADGIEVDYRTAQDVLFGIRLTLADQTVDWSAGRYLDHLEKLIGEALETPPEPADAA